MEGLEGSNRVITRIEDEKKDPDDRFIQKTIANLASQPQMLPSTAKKTKTKHPYTSYNIFFRLERAYILQSTEGIVDEEVLTSLDPNHSDPVEFPRPAKYSRVVLSPYWYSGLHSDTVEKKRRHRKRPGRMDLRTLSKTISESWRVADKDTVDYCIKLAQVDVKFYGYPGSVCHRSGKSKRSIEESDADTGAAAAAGRDLGDTGGAAVTNEKCASDTSQWTNANQQEIARRVQNDYQMLLSLMQTKKLSSSPDPDVRTIEAMNEYQRTRKMTNNEEVIFSSLHPKGIPQETREFFRSRSGIKVTTAVESHIDAIARRRPQMGMEMMVADEAPGRLLRHHSSNEGHDYRGFGSITSHYFTNGLSSQYKDCVFPKSRNLLQSQQNQFAEDSFLSMYGYPPQAPVSVLSLRRSQLLLSEVRRAARARRILSTRRTAVSYQSDMHTPQAVLRAMYVSRVTAPTLGLGIRGNSPQYDDSTMDSSKPLPNMDNPCGVLPNDDSAMDSRKPVPDLGIGDIWSPPNGNNSRYSPNPLPKLGIHNKSPPNNNIQTSDFIPRAISSSDVQDQQKTPESDNPICLFIPSDAKVLDPVHNFPRCHCIKLFEKRESDSTPGRVGQVGLRCFYCDETCLPSKREAIYENMLSFQRNHLESCPSFPKKMKAKYKTLVQQAYSSSQEKRPSHAFLRAYYAEAASELGLVDSPDGGLVFGAPQNTSGVPSKRLSSLLKSAGYNGLY